MSLASCEATRSFSSGVPTVTLRHPSSPGVDEKSLTRIEHSSRRASQTSWARGTLTQRKLELLGHTLTPCPERAERAALSSYFKQQGLDEKEIEQAIADFKKSRDAKKPDVAAIEKERDDARAELQTMKNQATLRSKGVRDEDLDYVQFKVDAMMKADAKLDFDKAVSAFLKENPRFTSAGTYKVKTGTDGSQGSSAGADGNTSINNAIRRAAGYKI